VKKGENISPHSRTNENKLIKQSPPCSFIH